MLNYMQIVNVARRLYPVQGSNVQVHVSYVLVEYPQGDVSVFAGVGDRDFVVDQGIPMTYEEAVSHYPYIKRENYRR